MVPHTGHGAVGNTDSKQLEEPVYTLWPQDAFSTSRDDVLGKTAEERSIFDANRIVAPLCFRLAGSDLDCARWIPFLSWSPGGGIDRPFFSAYARTGERMNQFSINCLRRWLPKALLLGGDGLDQAFSVPKRPSVRTPSRQHNSRARRERA